MPDLFDGEKPLEVRVVEAEARVLLGSASKHAAQVIIADPPYGTPLEPTHFSAEGFFARVQHALHPTGALYLFTRWDMFPSWAYTLPEGLIVENVIVWHKEGSAVQQTSNVPVHTFAFRHEFILMITKGNHRLRGERFANVWHLPRVPKPKVPGQKPVNIIRALIKASSDPGDIVMDPFCGSGTTGEAAGGRVAWLGDIDPAMVQLTCDRLGVTNHGVAVPREKPFPACPIFGVVPPAPHLWGLHPEDLAEFKAG
jgi:hypothetical protein